MNLFYWSMFPLHGLVWAENVEDAYNKTLAQLNKDYPNAKDAMDDIAIYPVYNDV